MGKLYEALGTIIGTLIIFLITSPVIERIKKSRLRNRFGHRMKADDEINKILFEIRSSHGFNRAALIEYHNGTTSLSGFGFKYATMTHESTDDITRPLILEFKEIPTSLMSSMLSELERSDRGFVVVHQNHPDETIKITHKMYGIVESWNFRVGSSLVDGCLMLGSTMGGVKLSEDDILDIRAKCQKILLIKKRGGIP